MASVVALANGSHGRQKSPPVPWLINGLQLSGLKGRLLLFLWLGLCRLELVLRWFLVNDCVCASVAHDFSIDFIGKHMPTKGYQKYVRNGRTDAFLGLGLGKRILSGWGLWLLERTKGTSG